MTDRAHITQRYNHALAILSPYVHTKGAGYNNCQDTAHFKVHCIGEFAADATFSAATPTRFSSPSGPLSFPSLVHVQGHIHAPSMLFPLIVLTPSCRG